MKLGKVVAVPILLGAMSGCLSKDNRVDVPLEELRRVVPEICAVDSDHNQILSLQEIETWQRVKLGLNQSDHFDEGHTKAMCRDANKLRSFQVHVKSGPNLDQSIQNFYTLIKREDDRLEKEKADKDKIKVDQNAMKAESEFRAKLEQQFKTRFSKH